MNVVIAFPKIENAKSIRSILMKSGYQVDAVCTTGGQALQNVNALDGGILICGYRFADMMCSEIQAYLPANFEMLLVASQSNTMNRDVSDVVCLSMPLKVHELLQTVEMMAYTYEKKRKKRAQKQAAENSIAPARILARDQKKVRKEKQKWQRAKETAEKQLSFLEGLEEQIKEAVKHYTKASQEIRDKLCCAETWREMWPYDYVTQMKEMY